MVGPVTSEKSSRTSDTDITQQQHYRLQLLTQAIEKVESECVQKQLLTHTSTPKNLQQQQQKSLDTLTMSASPSQQQELLMQLLSQQNMAAVMAAAAAAAQLQTQQQQRKLEPISPPSTSSASSTATSPIDFSSRRSTDDMNEGSTPPSLSPVANLTQHQLLSNMYQNLQSANHFPLLLTNKNGKPTRPFKAYPRDPLMLPLGFCQSATSEQTNLLADAASRAIPNRKRLAQTQERLKQRLQQQQQQLLSTTHFISSTGAQILQPPKKRHRLMENPVLNEEKPPTKVINGSSDDLTNADKDDAYWERRRKNNEAAKRSRDTRRAKEDEIALRAAILEQENMKLRIELSQLKQETAKLRCMVHTSS